MRSPSPACWLLFFCTAAACAAEDLTVETLRRGEFIEVQAHVIVDASLSVVWTTLTDYDRLPEFIPGLRRSKVVGRRGATVIIEQSGEARFLMFTFPIEVTLEAYERPPSSIKVRAVAGNFRFFEGAYHVEPEPNGSRIMLRWVGAIIPDVSLPPLIGEVVMRMRIEDQFTGMVREIERRESLRRTKEPGQK